MKLERPVCLWRKSTLFFLMPSFCRLEELCPLVLGVEALHSSSEKVKTCQEVKEVSSRKIFTNEE